MDYSTLRTELTKPSYAGLTDQQAADALNTLTVQRVRRVPIADLMEAAYRTGLIFALLVAQRSMSDPMALAVIDSVLMLKDARFEYVDVYAPDGTPDPATQQMFDALVEGGVMTGDQRAALEALAWETVAVWEPPVTPQDVHRARQVQEPTEPPVTTSSETLEVNGQVYAIVNLRQIAGVWYRAFAAVFDPAWCLLEREGQYAAVSRSELNAGWREDSWVTGLEYR